MNIRVTPPPRFPLHEAAGRDVLLLGSAPGVDLPVDTFDRFTICANGAALGLPHRFRPDVLFINSSTATRNPAGLIGRHASLECERMIVLRGEPDANLLLEVMLVRHAVVEFITRRSFCRHMREILPFDLHGSMGDDVPSTGVVALIYALASGAASVEMRGFSMSGGHAYLDTATRRYHTAVDARVFAWLRDTKAPVTGIPS